VPQPFGEQARMPGGGTWPRGPVLPRPRRNGCNRIRSSGTPDRPRGRTPSVQTPRNTLVEPSCCEGRRGSTFGVIGSSSDALTFRLGHRGEKRTPAPREQARPGVGMDELGVLAPGAGAGRTRVGVDPAVRGEMGVRHRRSGRSCVPHRHRLFGVTAVSVERPILPWSFGPITAM
jgi:hypothetical protein